MLCVFLTGCSGSADEIQTAMELRSKLLQSVQCTFDTAIMADYGDKVHTFTMNCQSDGKGDLTFTVSKPDTIAGISGKLSGEGGELIFDDTALHFDLLAEGQFSPISAPWILMRTLRSGYITSACREVDNIWLSVDDSYEDDPLSLDIWLNAEGLPEYADILYDGRRILSVALENFRIL